MFSWRITSHFNKKTNRRDHNKHTIFCVSAEDKKLVMEALRTLSIPANTFTEHRDKLLIFKLSGVSANDHSEVLEDLQKIGLKPSKVTFLMKPRPVAGKPTPTPIFLVHFEKGTIDLKTLKFSHGRAGMQCLTWETFNSARRRTTQCHRCQSWGHAESNCLRPPRCFKCAGEHHSSDCSADDSNPPAIRCINCNGDHTANSRTCPTRVQFEKVKETLIAKRRPQRLPLPQQPRFFEPQIGNAWQQRMQAEHFDDKNYRREATTGILHENGHPPVSNPKPHEYGHPPGSNAELYENGHPPVSNPKLSSTDRQPQFFDRRDFRQPSTFPTMLQPPKEPPVSFKPVNSQLSSESSSPLPQSHIPPIDELRSLVRELREGLNLLNQVKEFFPVFQALRKNASLFLDFCSQARHPAAPMTTPASSCYQSSPPASIASWAEEVEASAADNTLSTHQHVHENA